jgi:hypothetical protein
MEWPSFDTINQVAGLLASLIAVWQFISGFLKNLEHDLFAPISGAL